MFENYKPAFFSGCVTIEDIKFLYKTLVKQHHPDLGGDTATMQEINGQYQIALKRHDKLEDNEGHTYYYNEEVETAVGVKLAELLKVVGDESGCQLYLVGKWIWVHGDTKTIKDQLKEAGCRWAPKHTKWYWRHESSRSFGKGGEFEDIAKRYGMQEVRNGSQKGTGTALSQRPRSLAIA